MRFDITLELYEYGESSHTNYMSILVSDFEYQPDGGNNSLWQHVILLISKLAVKLI